MESYRIINGVIIRNLLTIPFREFQFQLVPLIPSLATVKTILVRSLIFPIFTRVENQPLKQRLIHKRHIILLFAEQYGDLLFHKIYHFLFNYNTYSFLRYSEQK